MAEAHTEDLVIRLEESLGISNIESGPKLVGAIIARKIANRGAIKTILTLMIIFSLWWSKMKVWLIRL